MNSIIGRLGAFGVAVGIAAAASASFAASVTFGNFGTTNVSNGGAPLVVPVVTANDETAGRITVSIGIDGGSPGTGLLTGVFLDYGDTAFTLADFNIPVLVDAFALNTINLGSGVNLNGGFSNGQSNAAFDVGFNFDPADADVAPNGGVSLASPFVFDFAAGALDLSSLSRIGLRFQSVVFSGTCLAADGDCGSDKVIGTPVAAVPLPAAGWLLLTGLAGLGFAAKRRRAA